MSTEHAPSGSRAPAGPVVTETIAAATDQITKAAKVETQSIKSVPSTQNPDGPIVGRPTEQLEVEEPTSQEPEIVYPTGSKKWFTFAALCVGVFLSGIDVTIVAVAVPSLTDHFKTIGDLGWYSAAYGLTGSSCTFLFGKLYTTFRTKHVYLFGLIMFEIGSAVCTFAQSSRAFIVGRAIAGFGSFCFGSGALKLLKDMFPTSKQALMIGLVGSFQSIGLVSAPMIGGLLIDAFSWRACFGINLPLGVLSIAYNAWALEEPNPPPESTLPLWEKIKQLELGTTLLVIPAMLCLLMALQWGGIKYGWSDWRIILMLVLFAVLFSAFMYTQYRLGDKACVPPRIAKQRSILGVAWFSACCNGILAVTEYYMSIYFQGVRGYTPTKSGLLGLPLIAGLTIANLAATAGINAVGYVFPFVFATSILGPIASGLLTTVDLDGGIVKPAALLGFLGVAVGFGLMSPSITVQTTLSSKDVSIGYAITGFAGGLGSALWICVSATLFQSRLGHEVLKYSPSTNATMLEGVGLSDIRTTIGSENLKNVLTGYNEAVVQTLYLPLALTILTIIGAVSVDRKNLKEKKA